VRDGSPSSRGRAVQGTAASLIPFRPIPDRLGRLR
jgi:hypothetical protein